MLMHGNDCLVHLRTRPAQICCQPDHRGPLWDPDSIDARGYPVRMISATNPSVAGCGAPSGNSFMLQPLSWRRHQIERARRISRARSGQIGANGRHPRGCDKRIPRMRLTADPWAYSSAHAPQASSMAGDGSVGFSGWYQTDNDRVTTAAFNRSRSRDEDGTPRDIVVRLATSAARCFKPPPRAYRGDCGGALRPVG